MKKKRIKLYLPENLNMEEHIKKYPLDNEVKLDHLYYILNKIYTLPTLIKDIEDNDGFVPLSASKLKNRLPNYRKCLDYLLGTGILISDNIYIVGEKPRGYKYTLEYSTKVKIFYHHTNSKLFKKNKKARQQDYWSQRQYPELKGFLIDDKLSIDFTGAMEYNHNMYESNMTLEEDERNRKFNYNYVSIERLRNSDYTFTVDDTGHRLHTNLTLLNKTLRPYLSYNGSQLTSLDLKNSQPFFSTVLFKPWFYGVGECEPNIPYYGLYESLKSNNMMNGITMFREVQQLADNEYVKKYIDLVVNGQIYEVLQEHLLEVYPQGSYIRKDDKMDNVVVDLNKRDDIKSEFMLAVYSSNQYYNKFKSAFNKLFPNVNKIFSLIREGDNSKLPVLLQRVESHIILDVICKRITKVHPTIPLYTIHDSITTTTGNIEFVKSVMEEEITKYVGYTPILQIEPWSKATFV